MVAVSFVFAGIHAVLLNLYLLRLGYVPEFISLVNAAGLLTLGVFSLPAGALGTGWGSCGTMIADLVIAVSLL